MQLKAGELTQAEASFNKALELVPNAVEDADFEALKAGRAPLSREDQATPFVKVLMEGWFFLIPIAVLVVLLLVLEIRPDFQKARLFLRHLADQEKASTQE